MAWFYIVLTLLLLAWWYRIWKNMRSTPDGRLPGPKGWPLIGNVLKLATSSLHLTISDMGERFGPIYKLKILDEHWVVLSEFELIREVLVSEGHVYSGRPGGFRNDVLAKGVGIPVSQDLNPTVKKIRQLMLKGLKITERIEKAAVTSHITELLDTFADKHGSAFDPMHDLYMYSCMIITQALLGENIAKEPNMFAKVLELNTAILLAVSPTVDGLLLDKCSWTRIFNGKAWKKCKETIQIFDYLYFNIKDKIIAGIEHSEGTNDQSLMHWVMNELQQQNGDLDDLSAKGILSGLIIGGPESTAITLYALICLLAHYPLIHKRLQEEVDDVIGKRTATLADRSKYHYVQATILEVMRNAGISPLLFPHKAMHNTRLGGYKIPKKTVILMNVWKLHHDSAFWDEPFEYCPERFINADGHLVPPHDPRRRRVIPFGGGSRVCPGKVFADNRVFLTLVALCQRFNINSVGKPNPAIMDPRKFECRGFIINPVEMNVSITERS